MASRLEKTMGKRRKATIPSALTTTTMRASATSLKFTDQLSQCGMPPACPGEAHVGCYSGPQSSLEDATALRGGVSRSLLSGSGLAVGSNVNLHGASPWHPKLFDSSVSSNQRETPPDKPVASLRVFPQSLPHGGTDSDLMVPRHSQLLSKSAILLFPMQNISCI